MAIKHSLIERVRAHLPADLFAEIEADLELIADMRPETRPQAPTPIADLMAHYTAEHCDFTNLSWVRSEALRQASTLPDSQARCLLYALAAAPHQVPVAHGLLRDDGKRLVCHEGAPLVRSLPVGPMESGQTPVPLYLKPIAAELTPSQQLDIDLGRTAMRFVDRAGDPTPGVDPAEKILAGFYQAMSEVINAHEEAADPELYARRHGREPRAEL